MRLIVLLTLAATAFGCGGRNIPFETADICASAYVFQVRLAPGVAVSCDQGSALAEELVAHMERHRVALMASMAWRDAVVWIHPNGDFAPDYEQQFGIRGAFDGQNGWVEVSPSASGLAHEALHYLEARALGVTSNGSRLHRSWVEIPGFAEADDAWQTSHLD